jgi:hypothetical protein
MPNYDSSRHIEFIQAKSSDPSIISELFGENPN